jgi:hypothetical protein
VALGAPSSSSPANSRKCRKISKEDLAATAFVKVTPKVISVLDYSKGFGHTDLVRP